MSKTVRIDILREEFERLGYTYEAVVMSGVSYTRFISPDGIKWLYKDANGRLPLPYVSASDILNNKVTSANYAEGKGIRIPRVTRIDLSNVLSLMEYRGMLGVDNTAGVVVKPADSTLSRGVSADVRSEEELNSAIKNARQYSVDIIAQERVEGDEYRFVYVGAGLKAVIQKQKLKVTGDGVSSVGELVERENKARSELKGLRVAYPRISPDSLQEQGVELDVVLLRDEVRMLSDSTVLEQGASFYEVSETIHSSYIDIADRLASDFGGGYLAVDIIINNHVEPASPNNYAFLEFNDIPAPTYFYACRNKTDVPVMRELVCYLDKALHLAASERQK